MCPLAKIDHVSTNTAKLYGSASGNDDDFMQLLWGDRVEVLEEASRRVKIRARGRKKIGWMSKSALGGDSLLELYFIDVGQGDGS